MYGRGDIGRFCRLSGGRVLIALKVQGEGERFVPFKCPMRLDEVEDLDAMPEREVKDPRDIMAVWGVQTYMRHVV
jgi:Holliday junction resolvase